jgi:MoxR-like ATPase
MTKSATEAIEKLQKIEKELNNIFVERSPVIHGLILSALAKTNILLLGPPGTAKSDLVNRWNQHIANSKFFGWLVTRFSTPEELFGSFSLKGLKNDEYYRVTTARLPEANTAFIDEIFKSSSGMLNSLLPIMNERIFYNNGKPIKIPLITLAGASNEVPEKEDRLDAIYDRFLLKYNVSLIREDSNFLKMLEMLNTEPQTTITLEQIIAIQELADKVTLSEEVLEYVLRARKELHNQGVMISDRAFKLILRIVKAEVILSGRMEARIEDLEILQHTCWQDPNQIRKVQTLILDVISPEKSKIQKLFNDSSDIVNNFWQSKESSKKTDKAIEVTTKLKTARQEISKYKEELRRKNKDIKETESMEASIDRWMQDLYMKVLGLSFPISKT